MRTALLLTGLVFLLGCKSTYLTEVYSSENLKIIQVGKHSYQHITYLDTESFGKVACNGMVVIDQGEALIYDTPSYDKDAEELTQWIEAQGARVKGVIVNHFHIDCLGSLTYFHKANIPSFGNRITIDLAQKAGYTAPLKDIGIKPHTVGNVSIQNAYLGPAHTQDNNVSYVIEDAVLFGGCMVKSLGAGEGYTGDATLDKWSETVSKINQAFPKIKTVIPGHGKAGGTELLEYTIQKFEKYKLEE